MNRKRFLPPAGAFAAFLLMASLLTIRGCEMYYGDMQLVEAGQFEMGCDDCQESERPVHTVKLKGFWIDKYEVTNQRYAEFLNMGLNGGWVYVVQKNDGLGDYLQAEINNNRVLYLYPSVSWSQVAYVDGRFAAVEGKEECPVTVSWHGAQAYCEAFHKRLPTEAEWEYAAKGGHLSRFRPGEVGYFRYSGSDDADVVAWHRYNSSSSRPVGQLQANELGVLDMSGNLREWTNDWCDLHYYSTSPQEDPQGPPEPVYSPEMGTTLGKVMRGGSWRENTYRADEDQDLESTVDQYRVRVTKRDYGCPCNLSERTGFRCAADRKALPWIHFLNPFSTVVKPKSRPPDKWPTAEANPEKPAE